MATKKYLMKKGAYKREKPPDRYEILNFCELLDSPRDKALLSFLYLTGCRIEEVVKYSVKGKLLGHPIKKEQIDIRYNMMIIRNVRVLKSRQKNVMKSIPILFNKLERPFIRLFMQYYKTLRRSDYLFDITRQRAWQILHAANVFPHLLRHCRSTHLIIDYDFSAAQLQQFIGWKKLDSASDYLHLSVKDLIKKMKETQ